MLDPAAVSCLKFCKDEYELNDMFGELELDKYLTVLVPLNNSTDLKTSGDHWALLVCCQDECFYLDSASGQMVLAE